MLGVRRSRPGTLLVATGLVCAAVLMSWLGAVTAAAFVLLAWFSRRSDRDRPALVVLAAAGVLAAALSGAWFLAATSTSDLRDQVEFRTTGGSFTPWEFVGRQVGGTLSLVPIWALGLAAAGAWAVRRTPGPAPAGLRPVHRHRRRFRGRAAERRYIHDYWIYPALGALGARRRIGDRRGAATMVGPAHPHPNRRRCDRDQCAAGSGDGGGCRWRVVLPGP